MSLPRLLKRPSSAIFTSSRAHHPLDPVSSVSARHARWASIVPFTFHHHNPPPPPLTPDQVLAQSKQQQKFGTPPPSFEPLFSPDQQQSYPELSPQLTQEEFERRLEHQQRLRQQEELQQQLQRHRDALQQQQLKRQIQQELELAKQKEAEEEKRCRATEAASTASKTDEKLTQRQMSLADQEGEEQRIEKDVSRIATEQRPEQRSIDNTTAEQLRKQRRSTFGYYFQFHHHHHQQHQQEQKEQTPVRDLVQEAVTKTLSISTKLPKRIARISFEDRVKLAMMDYTGSQIDAMTPEQASEILAKASTCKETSTTAARTTTAAAAESSASMIDVTKGASSQYPRNSHSSAKNCSSRQSKTVTRRDHSEVTKRLSHQEPSSEEPETNRHEINAFHDALTPVETNHLQHHHMSSLSSSTASPKASEAKSRTASLQPMSSNPQHV
ncbi:hypothetical protein BGW42_000725 [Actinomortierella wolfii]|nr:hypothetical protein BGW42_000725 [Actinomortierella wolfii]